MSLRFRPNRQFPVFSGVFDLRLNSPPRLMEDILKRRSILLPVSSESSATTATRAYKHVQKLNRSIPHSQITRGTYKYRNQRMIVAMYIAVLVVRTYACSPTAVEVEVQQRAHTPIHDTSHTVHVPPGTRTDRYNGHR